MIEIIKHGKMHNIRICSSCECKFKFSQGDVSTGVRLRRGYGLRRFLDTYEYILCPECHNKIILKPEQED